MIVLRRLGLLTLILAFGQVVFGAIVRITGSGMGCGDHWPKCLGHWVPPLDRPDLIIEVTHRWIALALSISVVALLVLAWQRRRLAGVGGPRGVLRPVALAAALVVTAALLGAVLVTLDLHAQVVVAHLAIAMTLLATLVVAVIRAGGLGAPSAVPGSGSPKAARGAMAAAGLAFAVLVLGALTATVTGAAQACQGFPLCNGSVLPTAASQHIQIVHRLLAFLLFFHLIGLTVGTARRGEPTVIVRATRLALAAVIVQIIIAAALVETFLPPVLQSMHQAMGTLVWIAIVSMTMLARQASRPVGAPAIRRLDDGDAIARTLEPAR
jgi:heme A synthase